MNERIGNFTSSKIVALTKSGKAKGSFGLPFYTYIQEKRDEIQAGRSMQNESNANANTWGNLCEKIAFNLIDMEYQLESKKRYTHLTLPMSGCPDLRKPKKKLVGDIKCPFTLTAFMKVVNIRATADQGEALKSVVPDYYWQLVSNAILTDSDDAELIMFMPKLKRIEEIKEASADAGLWFQNKADEELPWTGNDSPIPELIYKAFTVPQADKDFLLERVAIADKLLNYFGDLTIKEFHTNLLNESKA